MRSWDLFREMEQLQREIDSAFRGTGFGDPATSGFGLRRYPKVNLREDADNLYLEILLPGVDPQQVDLSMLGNTLTLSGERAGEDEAGNGRIWHRLERGTGKFLRSIELPAEVDVDRIKAEAKNGLMLVTLPKAAAAKPQKIAIKVA
ncbi:MAG: Hsp20/alpha crystallin family protein [Desulfuromonadales bacterium]|nr:Hsp20/alpha crystallin family protein [Desulfuromonadales bacterium]